VITRVSSPIALPGRQAALPETLLSTSDRAL